MISSKKSRRRSGRSKICLRLTSICRIESFQSCLGLLASTATEFPNLLYVIRSGRAGTIPNAVVIGLHTGLISPLLDVTRFSLDQYR
jgi:hypothetical protein